MAKRKRKRKSKRRKSAGPTLFDLPLHGGGEASADVEIRHADSAPPDRGPAGVTPPAATAPEETPVAGPATRGPSILFDREADKGPQLDRMELDSGPAVRAEPGPEKAAPSAWKPHGKSERRPDDKSERKPDDKSERVAAPTDDKAYLGDRLLGGLADLAAQLIALGLAIAATHALGLVVTVDDWGPFGVLALVFSFLYWMVPLAFWGQTPGMAWVGHTARSSSGEPLSFGQTFMRWLGSIVTLAFAGLPLLIALTGRSFTDRISDSRTTAA